VAALFQRLYAVVCVVAWVSLASQVPLLIGSRGLLPVSAFIETARSHEVSYLKVPSLFWFASSDIALGFAAGLGLVSAACAAIGLQPRRMIGLQAALYLSFAVAGRTFLSFQWDNLLIECGALAIFLPTDRPRPLVHLMFRVLLFKLYFESGIAKWQSHLHDWQDGSAMTFYFETAPIPTRLAWYAHALPAAWHHVESYATLVLELVLPLGAFGPRRVRRALFLVLTGFQVVNAATANYGFFCYLSVALHVFLLDDADVAAVARRLPRLGAGPSRDQLPRSALVGLLVVYTALSLVDGLLTFAPGTPADALEPVWEHVAPFRLINTYHLFGHITRERIEPELQISDDGEAFRALDFKRKPGAVERPPPFVAPHQPRVDFQLWFYGLSFRSGTPEYVVNLVDRLCHDPDRVAELFVDAPSRPPRAVRLAYYEYHFTRPAERRATGHWWKRTLLGTTAPVECHLRPG
jgi:hypothetical protein